MRTLASKPWVLRPSSSARYTTRWPSALRALRKGPHGREKRPAPFGCGGAHNPSPAAFPPSGRPRHRTPSQTKGARHSIGLPGRGVAFSCGSGRFGGSAAPLAAVLDLVPAARPLLAPIKRPSAMDAILGGQMRLAGACGKNIHPRGSGSPAHAPKLSGANHDRPCSPTASVSAPAWAPPSSTSSFLVILARAHLHFWGSVRGSLQRWAWMPFQAVTKRRRWPCSASGAGAVAMILIAGVDRPGIHADRGLHRCITRQAGDGSASCTCRRKCRRHLIVFVALGLEKQRQHSSIPPPDRFDLGQPGLLFWMLCRPWRKVPSPTRHHCEIRCLQESGHHRLNLRGFSAKASTVGQHQPAEAERRVVHAVVRCLCRS